MLLFVKRDHKAESNKFRYLFTDHQFDAKTTKAIALNYEQIAGDGREFVIVMSYGISVVILTPSVAGLAQMLVEGTNSPLLLSVAGGFTFVGLGLDAIATKFLLRPRRHRKAMKHISRMNSIEVTKSKRGEYSSDWYSFKALRKARAYNEVSRYLFGDDYVEKSFDLKRYRQELEFGAKQALFRRIKPHIDAYFAITAQHDIALKALGNLSSYDKRRAKEEEVDACAALVVEEIKNIIDEDFGGKMASKTLVQDQQRQIADCELDQLPSIAHKSFVTQS